MSETALSNAPGTPALPFQSFTFTLVENRRPRTALSLRAQDGGAYALHVEKGSASNPTSQFTREIPVERAQALKDSLQDIGVFGWEESYGTAADRAERRWSVNTVFKEGVFTVSSRGGAVVPAGFDRLLEELYRLDFPRPKGSSGSAGQADAGRVGLGSALNSMGLGGMGSIGGMNAGDLAARASAGSLDADLSQLGGMFQDGGTGELNGEELARLMAEIQRDPQALQARMREEFRHMPQEEQGRLLDMLASMSGRSRAWWERFLRG